MNDLTTVVVVLIVVLLIVWLIVWLQRKDETTKAGKKGLDQLTINEIHTKMTKTAILPTFLRPDGKLRFAVTAARVKLDLKLPTKFDSRERWPGAITKVMDQGECGSCWAFSSCTVFSDRIKIAKGGLAADDYISQYSLAACMKCREGEECKLVCNGHYMDEVMEYLTKSGGYSYNDVNAKANYGNKYICYKAEANGVKPYRASGAYRVNPYSIAEINDAKKREINEKTIMADIYEHGPVTCTIQVFDPVDKANLAKNFYLYKGEGVYGYPWDRDPSSTDGYHAMAIIGWGEDVVGGKVVKYWIVRNSWSERWGQDGYGKVARGQNRCIIESDIWTPSY
jgi:hypothetical protein